MKYGNIPMGGTMGFQCDPRVPYLIDASADLAFRKGDINALVMVAPANSWQLLEDRHDKFGWIADLKGGNGSLILQPITPYHPPADTKGISFGLSVHYLATYKNAGVADVLLCGVKVASLDALWQEHDTYHFSLTEVSHLRLLLAECTTKVPIVEVKYLPQSPTSPDNSDRRFAARLNQKFKITRVQLCVLEVDQRS
jgi:hypothetical protein